MPDDTLTVVARVRLKKERLDAATELLKGLVGPTRQEPGCIAYALHQSNDDPCSFVFLECWRSQADLDSHLQRPHLKAFVAQADEILAEPLDITLWHPVAP